LPLRTTLGVDWAAEIQKISLGLRPGWQHEYADTARPMTAAFAGYPFAASELIRPIQGLEDHRQPMTAERCGLAVFGGTLGRAARSPQLALFP
jgi:hypothetical protein